MPRGGKNLWGKCLLVVVAASLVVGACAPTAPPPAPTKAPAVEKAPPAAPAPVKPAAPPAAPKEVAIGVVTAQTGALGPAGLETIWAVNTALDLVNNKHNVNLPLAKTEGLPNLGGAKVRAIISDHQAKTEIALGETERLITQEKVVGLTDMFISATTAVGSQVAERLGVPVVAGGASSPKLTERGFKWFFRTGPHDGMFSEAMFEFLKEYQAKKGLKFKTIALIWEDTVFGTDSSDTQKELAKKFGYEVVADIKYRAGTTSLTSEVQRLKAANPDILFPTNYASDAILMHKTMRELDYNPKMIIGQNAGYTMGPALDAAKPEKLFLGVLSRNVYADDLFQKIPQVGYVNEIYKKYSGGKAILDIPLRWVVGVLTLLDAINRAGSTEPEAIRKALVETNIPADQLPLPYRGVKFDPKTQQNILAVPIITQINEKGEHVTVWPFNWAAMEPIYPIPTWAERK